MRQFSERENVKRLLGLCAFRAVAATTTLWTFRPNRREPRLGAFPSRMECFQPSWLCVVGLLFRHRHDDIPCVGMHVCMQAARQAMHYLTTTFVSFTPPIFERIYFWWSCWLLTWAYNVYKHMSDGEVPYICSLVGKYDLWGLSLIHKSIPNARMFRQVGVR